MIKYSVKLNAKSSLYPAIKNLVFTENDSGNILEFNIVEKGNGINVADDFVSTVTYERPDGETFVSSSEIVNKTNCLIKTKIPKEVLSKLGKGYMSVQLYDGKGDRVTSILLEFNVTRELKPNGEITDEENYLFLIDLIKSVNELEEKVTANEDTRDNNEKLREDNEEDRDKAETIRKVSEIKRSEEEIIRIESENTRKLAEKERLLKESERQSYEEERKDAESKRNEQSDKIQVWLDDPSIFKGEKGDKGEIGERGPRGVEGLKGDKGETGARGPEGPQGPAGIDGLDGKKGDKGEQGEQGIQGPIGPKGDTGEKGEQGVKGDKGDVGAGLNIISSLPSVDDLPTQAKPGDAYTIDGELYVYGYDGKFTNIGYIKGEKGDKGEKGEQGPSGEKGDKGDKGEQGIQGPQGLKGDDGLRGPKGEKGEAGLDGADGLDGKQGERGPQGIKGDKGEKGPQGPIGLQGLKGDPFVYEDFTPTQLDGLKGPKGDKGPSGIDGLDGKKGDKGEQGEVGPEGPIGPKGDKGEKGDPGKDGEKGDPGTTEWAGITDKPIKLSQFENDMGFISGNVLDEHKAEIATQAHLAKNIEIEDLESNFVATDLEGAMNELFTNVNNGKNLIGGAIIDVDSNINIPTNPSFDDLANAIGQISTGRKWASGEDRVNSNKKLIVNGLGFKPSIVLAKERSPYNPVWDTSVYVAKNVFTGGSGASGAPPSFYTDGRDSGEIYEGKAVRGNYSFYIGGFDIDCTNADKYYSWIAFE